MNFQKLYGGLNALGADLVIGGTQFLSRHKWVRTPDQQALALGEGEFRYSVDRNWCKTTPDKLPVRNCHEMVMDRRGRIYLLTDHPKNNVIILDTEGNPVGHWTLNSSGAHGLTITQEGEVERLWICDPYSGTVVQTALDGTVLRALPGPHALGLYRAWMPYSPTQTAVAPNGDIYVADGYGSQHVLQFNAAGEFIRLFGGRQEDEQRLDFAHGIAVDSRQGPGNEVLLVTSRRQSCIKQFSLDGRYLGKIALPGGYPCRPVIHGSHLLVSLCWSGSHLRPNSGFVLILDQQNTVCAALGGTAHLDKDGRLVELESTYSAFCHVHDVCADPVGNIYVCQWNAGESYPVKLMRQSLV